MIRRISLREYLKDHGYAKSNKEAKRLIRAKKVTVNGIVAESCFLKVLQNTTGAVVVQGGSSEGTSNSTMEPENSVPFCIVYHKPCGLICSYAEEENGTKSRLNLQHASVPAGFRPVGRLDQHSHGLLLWSSDGRLTTRLLSSAVERVYELVVRGDVGTEDSETRRTLARRVHEGVATDYGFFQGNILAMDRNASREYEHSKCGINCGGERNDVFGGDHGANNILRDGGDNDDEILSSITVAVNEGKKRMVRRLFAALGFFVVDLKRIRYGTIALGDCRVGEWRHLTRDEQRYATDLILGNDVSKTKVSRQDSQLSLPRSQDFRKHPD